MRDLKDDALAVAAWGWHVFPIHSPDGERCDCHRPDCSSPAKHPRTRRGLLDATTSLDTVLRWWEMWPQANLAVRTGEPSGIVVMDVDPRHNGDATLGALIEEHGPFPYMPYSRTGSGGNHYFFRWPGQRVPSTSNVVGPGIDVRGDGGYVLLPPSVHQTGVSYVWEYAPDVDCVPVDIPGWLLELMLRKGGSDKFPKAPQVPEDVPHGARNATLASLGGTLRRRGLSESAIFGALMAINGSWSQPLDRTDVARVAASVARYEPEVAIRIVDDLPPDERRQPTRLPQPFRLSELVERELPEVRCAVEGILPEGLAVLAGKPKLGKSFWALDVGLAIAEGGIALGAVPVAEGDVLILALEDNERRLKSRTLMLRGGEPIPDRIEAEVEWPRQDQGGIEALDSWLGMHPNARLVVIDTLAKFRPQQREGGRRGDLYAEDYAAIETLQRLALRHGVCILLITHYRKAFSDDWVDSITGTLGVSGSADTLLGLERPRGSLDAVLHITGRDVDERDLAMKKTDVMGWIIQGDAEEYRVGKEMAEFLLALERRGRGDPVHVNEIAQEFPGKKRDTIARMARRAAEEGRCLQFGKGYFGPISAADMQGGVSMSAMSVLGFSPIKRGQTDTTDTTDTTDKRTSTERSESIPAQNVVASDHVSDSPGVEGSDAVPMKNGHLQMSADVRLSVPCPVCGSVAWVQTVSGVLCGVCRPAVRVVRDDG